MEDSQDFHRKRMKAQDGYAAANSMLEKHGARMSESQSTYWFGLVNKWAMELSQIDEEPSHEDYDTPAVIQKSNIPDENPSISSRLYENSAIKDNSIIHSKKKLKPTKESTEKDYSSLSTSNPISNEEETEVYQTKIPMFQMKVVPPSVHPFTKDPNPPVGLKSSAPSEVLKGKKRNAAEVPTDKPVVSEVNLFKKKMAAMNVVVPVVETVVSEVPPPALATTNSSSSSSSSSSSTNDGKDGKRKLKKKTIESV